MPMLIPYRDSTGNTDGRSLERSQACRSERKRSVVRVVRSHFELRNHIRCALAAFVAVIVFFALERGGDASSSFLFKEIPVTEINKTQMEEAKQTVIALYEKWQAGTFEPVSEGFTAKMRNGLTPELQEQSFKQIKAMFGDFKGLTFVEVLIARFFYPRGLIYRFKGAYSGTSQHPEIRVVFDSDGKVSGLWIKPWRDEIQ